MPISIHLPHDVLRLVDRRAKSLGLSRSGYITQALRRDTGEEGGWSPGFFDRLRDADDEVQAEADALVELVSRRRSRKGPVRL